MNVHTIYVHIAMQLWTLDQKQAKIKEEVLMGARKETPEKNAGYHCKCISTVCVLVEARLCIAETSEAPTLQRPHTSPASKNVPPPPIHRRLPAFHIKAIIIISCRHYWACAKCESLGLQGELSLIKYPIPYTQHHTNILSPLFQFIVAHNSAR